MGLTQLKGGLLQELCPLLMLLPWDSAEGVPIAPAEMQANQQGELQCRSGCMSACSAVACRFRLAWDGVRKYALAAGTAIQLHIHALCVADGSCTRNKRGLSFRAVRAGTRLAWQFGTPAVLGGSIYEE
jgi:hypothetical protein